MSRLTDNDRKWGPLTWGPWTKTFSITLSSTGDDEREDHSKLRFIGFGWVLQVRIPKILPPLKVKIMARSWDDETVQRLGRNWYWDVRERVFGFSLSDMGNGYDLLQVFFGPQTHDSSTTKSWCKHLPWKQWRHVRKSLYDQDGLHFYSELDDNRKKNPHGWRDSMKFEELCPKVHFGFEDHDGEMIVATTHIEEREWRKGTGWFKWLRFFYEPKIIRSLYLHFSEEVGPEKGSWKGGTIGHSADMLPGELHEAAFRRYCSMEHRARGNKTFKIRFIGQCGPPPEKPESPKEQTASTESTSTQSVN